MSSELTIISNKVYEKLEHELDDFKAKLKAKSPDEIISSAYELVSKEDILAVFESKENFKLQDYKALLKCKKPLEYLYQEWLSYDVSAMDAVRDSVNFAIEKQCEYLKEKAERDKDCR